MDQNIDSLANSANHNLPAVFLDRDGVIIHNRANYVRTWEQVKIYPNAIPALAKLAASPYAIVIITNQSAVGRGLVARSTVDEINARLMEQICLGGGRVDGIYVCPHAPQENCTCRKPQPGLIRQAAKDLQLNLSLSILIGDAFSDLQAAEQAGIPNRILVKTGRGNRQLNLHTNHHLQKNLLVYKSIDQAINFILRTENLSKIS